MTSILDSALEYARRGWPVVQLAGKKPILDDWPVTASTDPAVITAWWKERPRANVGIVTGTRSGIWVLDVDPRHDGLETLAGLEQEHGELATRRARTGSDGLHLVYRMPAGVELRNRQGVLPGVDVRATGGQFAAAPSIHPDTKRAYAWENELPIAEPPAWLVELVRPKEPVRPVYLPPAVAVEGSREVLFVSKGLRMACQDIVEAQARGESRHKVLHAKAIKFGGYIAVPELQVDEALVVAELQRAGEAAGKDSREVARTIRDGIAAGMLHPCRPNLGPSTVPATPNRAQVMAWWEQHPEMSSREVAQEWGIPAGTLRSWAARTATPPPVAPEGTATPPPVAPEATPVAPEGTATPPPVAPEDALARLVDALAHVKAAAKGAAAEPLLELLGDRAWLREMGEARASDALFGFAELARLGSAAPHGSKAVIKQIELAIAEAQKALVNEAREGLAQSRPRPVSPRPRLLLSNSYQDTAKEVLPFLEKGGRVFQRARQLVHIARDGRMAYGVETPVQTPSIDTFVRASLLNEISGVVDTWKPAVNRDGMPIERPTLCPAWVAESVLALPAYPFPLLQGLTPIPIFRPNGTIHTTSGYDQETGYYFEPPGTFRVEIPARVSKDDARAAVECLLAPLVDFPFDAPHHKSAVLAAILTLVARPGIKGPSPMFLYTASTPKSGKSKLVDIVIGIATGHRAPRMSPVEEEAEMEKRIFASLMAGHAAMFIDNIEGAFGGPSLDALLTSWPDYEGRELGLSKTHRVPARTVWMASGNNVSIRGDLAQRVIPIHLVPDCERPELRSGFRYPEVVDNVIEERELLLSAAYGLLRGYVQAGRPDMGLSTFGGFEAWSRLVRGALVWAGLADPYAGVAALTEAADERRAMLEGLLSAWYERWGSQPRWLADMPADITAEGTPVLWEKVIQLCGGRDRRLDTHRLGQVLRRSAGRIIGGYRAETIDQKRHGAKGWTVRKVGEAEEPPLVEPPIPY